MFDVYTGRVLKLENLQLVILGSQVTIGVFSINLPGQGSVIL